MSKISQLLQKYDIKPNKYLKQGKVTIVETKENKYVIKENSHNDEIYNYLKSRSFDYFPRIINDPYDDYEITVYEDAVKMPEEQKIYDMIELVALLHSKTSFYKSIDNDEYKKIFEDLSNNIEYLYSYYSDLITVIETKVYMSPSEYLIARNIAKIFNRLDNSKKELDNWYNLMKDKEKVRHVVLHNNLEPSHFIKNDNNFLINWDKSKIDMPIFDLYKFYLRNSEYNFEDILDRYEQKYPLLKEEKILLFLLIKIPELPNITNDEFINTNNIRKILLNIEKSNSLKLPNDSKYEPDH